MKDTSVFQEVRSSTSRSPHIISYAINDVNPEQVPGTLSVPSFPSLSPQGSASNRGKVPDNISYHRHVRSSQVIIPRWRIGV